MIEKIPLIGRKVKSRPVFATCGVLVRGTKVWMRKRPGEGLLGGMWEFPGSGMLDAPPGSDALWASWRESFGEPPSQVAALGSVRHVFSHLKLRLEVFEVDAVGPGVGDGVWKDWRALDSLAVSKLTRKVWALVASHRELT